MPRMKRAASTPPRAGDEPATVKAPRTRPPPDDERPPLAERDVEEYLERFELGVKKKGGNGKRHTPDRKLIASLRDAASQRSCCEVDDEVEEESEAAACCKAAHDVINAYGVGRIFVHLNPKASNKLKDIVAHLQKRWPVLQSLSLRDGKALDAEVAALVDVIAQFGAGKFCKDGKGGKKSASRRSPCAASKLLAVLGRPVPIYDSLARKALGLPGNVTYEAFYVRWMESYEPLRGAYEAAVAARWDRVAAAGVDVTPEYICVRAHDVRLMGLALGGL